MPVLEHAQCQRKATGTEALHYRSNNVLDMRSVHGRRGQTLGSTVCAQEVLLIARLAKGSLVEAARNSMFAGAISFCLQSCDFVGDVAQCSRVHSISIQGTCLYIV